MEDPPPPLAWDEYVRRLDTAWSDLLEEKADDERDFQSFIENHPSLLLGLSGSYVGFDRRRPYPGAVVSQPVLRGLTVKVPDFLWITYNSAFVYPILLEIETPAKRWFNADGVQNARFTQSHDQLAVWETWFESDVNRLWFREYYDLPEVTRRSHRLDPIYILVIGRRGEFEDKPDLNRKRATLHRSGELLATFDRLEPHHLGRSIFSVRKTDDGYRALAFPPTFEIHASEAEWLSKVQDKEQAVERSLWMSDERKAFLIERFPYWDDLARRDKLRYITGPSKE